MKIGIIARDEFKDGIGNDFNSIFQNLNVQLITIDEYSNLDIILKECDALLVPGNCNNIPPSYYNEQPIVFKYEKDDFKLDKQVISMFYNAKKPILAICGGSQSINVCFGGSLNQFVKNHDLDNKLHNITIKGNSFLYDIYKKSNIKVNSLHEQSINRVADNFIVTAISDDGIIEGIEYENIVAVQWHPEKMNDILFFKTWIENYLK